MEDKFVKMGFEESSTKEDIAIYHKEFSKDEGIVQICLMYDTRKKKITSVEGIYINEDKMQILEEKEVQKMIAM